MTRTKPRSWWIPSGKNYEVAVIELPSGQWLGSMGLKRNLDPSGSSEKQEVFGTAEEALSFVGYPWEMVGLPGELGAK